MELTAQSQPAEIREWQDVDKQIFDEKILSEGRPAVLRGFADAWPIVAKATDSRRALVDYISSFGIDTPVKAFFANKDVGGRFFYNDELTGFNFERRELSLGDLLNTLLDRADDENADAIYAGAIPLTDSLAQLIAANINPLLDPEMEQLVSIWIGNRGRTAPHWDLPQNIAVVISGERTFTVFPPEQLPNLYVGPIDVTIAGQPISLVDLHNPDFDKFPRFREALSHAHEARLKPGDAIYLPSMWFHHVESHDPLSVLINYWWRDAEPYMITPLFTLLHGLLSIREMPQHERDIWRQMFDHYLFQTDGDPMEHIPEEARGIFQKMTPERVAGLREYLLKSLGGVPRR